MLSKEQLLNDYLTWLVLFFNSNHEVQTSLYSNKSFAEFKESFCREEVNMGEIRLLVHNNETDKFEEVDFKFTLELIFLEDF